ncbi:MAG: nitrilase-related carbon-nitrogen hydrolase, partial [Verrucomicrobiota bacterium]
YGTGLALALAIPLAHRWMAARRPGGWGHRLPVIAWLAALAALSPAWRPNRGAGEAGGPALAVAGVQLEFPAVPDVLAGLDRARERYPGAPLFVLSEYTFDGPVPEPVRRWCREHRRWLVAGGKQALTPEDTRVAGGEHRPLWRPWSPAAPGAFRNTAFVIGPDGQEVFSQAKAQPIQFFQDGLPAERQQAWESPWGRLGIAVCYDASYRRVMDPLVRQGAQALILPTMDVEEWGRYEHELNARQARLRAAEYGLPVFRLASSGPSELLDARGRVIAAAGVPGPGEVVGGRISLPARGSVPLDAWLGPGAALATVGTALALGIAAARRRLRPVAAVHASTPRPLCS